VATSADLPDGAVRPFTAGAVTGYVSWAGGRLRAVSGICTHQGCRLILGAPGRQKADGPGTLVCPCHGATFATDGAVLTHRLPITLTALPLLDVREAGEAVQAYAKHHPRGPVRHWQPQGLGRVPSRDATGWRRTP
jgi:Rieske Fe-S protein